MVSLDDDVDVDVEDDLDRDNVAHQPHGQWPLAIFSHFIFFHFIFHFFFILMVIMAYHDNNDLCLHDYHHVFPGLSC